MDRHRGMHQSIDPEEIRTGQELKNWHIYRWTFLLNYENSIAKRTSTRVISDQNYMQR